jgi:ABC-type branched-subunit amino acid transport system substrate-binding protein
LLHGLMKQDNSLAKIPFASGGALMNEGSTTDLGSFLGGPVYAIAPVGDPSQSGTNGQIFLGDYDATYDDSPTPYSASAYDCTNILIQAIQKALDDGIEAPTNTDDQQNAQKFRQKVIDELHSSSFSSQGVTGVYSFDRNSDTTNPTVSIYQLSNDHWYLKKMETYLSKDTSWHLKYISQ